MDIIRSQESGGQVVGANPTRDLDRHRVSDLHQLPAPTRVNGTNYVLSTAHPRAGRHSWLWFVSLGDSILGSRELEFETFVYKH